MATIQSTIQINDKFSKALRSLSSGLDGVIHKLKRIESTASKLKLGGGFTVAAREANKLATSVDKVVKATAKQNSKSSNDEYKAHRAVLKQMEIQNSLDHKQLEVDYKEFQLAQKVEKMKAKTAQSVQKEINLTNQLNESTNKRKQKAEDELTTKYKQLQADKKRIQMEAAVHNRNIELEHVRLKENEKIKKKINEILGTKQNIKKTQDKINGSVNNYNKKLGNANRTAVGLWGNLKRIAGTYLSLQAGKTLINAADTYGNTKARLNMLTNSDEETKELQNLIYEYAQRSRSSYTDLTNSVAKLGMLAGNSFNGNHEIVKFAELVQKQFAISGSTVQEMSAAMYQLTQAMSSGALKGDEFKSIIENAPMIAETIAKYVGVSEGELQDLASEGLITSDIIKNAMFAAASKTEERFKKLPLSFGGMWQQVLNKVNKAFEPIYEKLQSIWNSDKFQKFVDALVNGFVIISAVAAGVFDVIVKLTSFIYDNWSLIAPVIWGVVAAMVALQLQTLKNVAATIAHMIVSALQTLYLTLLYVKSHGVIYALKQLALAQGLCASTAMIWVLIIIAVIAVFYLLIAIINKVCGTSISATGIIAGVFAMLFTFLFDIIKGFWNFILWVVQSVANFFISLAETIYNAFNNGFTGWISGVKSALWTFVNCAYQLIKPLIKVWDKLKGTDLASSLQTKIDNGMSQGRTSNYVKFDRANLVKDYGGEIKNPLDSYKKGYAWGEKAEDKLASALDFSSIFGKNTMDDVLKNLDTTGGIGKTAAGMGKDPASTLGGAGGIPKTEDLLKQIADNTAGTNDELMRNNADMSYLRDLAERKAINKISDIKVKVDMTNNNTVNSEFDLDKIADYLGEKVFSTITSSAAGVHY